MLEVDFRHFQSNTQAITLYSNMAQNTTTKTTI
jgi:hypothetical protein